MVASSVAARGSAGRGPVVVVSVIAVPLIDGGTTDGHPSIVRNPAAELLCRHGAGGPPSLVGGRACSHPSIRSKWPATAWPTGMPTALRATSVWSWPGRGAGPVELGAGVDVQLGEDVSQVYFTVRTLMNNRLRISAFRPSRASRTIRVSWGQCTEGRDGALRAVSPVASSSRLARSANASMSIASSRSWAVRSCARASMRRRWRRSHSP